MSKKYTYDIGNNRLLKIAKKYDQLCIEEKGSVKSATFTPFRWPSILLCLAFFDSFRRRFRMPSRHEQRVHLCSQSNKLQRGYTTTFVFELAQDLDISRTV